MLRAGSRCKGDGNHPAPAHINTNPRLLNQENNLPGAGTHSMALKWFSVASATPTNVKEHCTREEGGLDQRKAKKCPGMERNLFA